MKMVLSVALVDAMIKDSDIIAVRPAQISPYYLLTRQIFRAVHQLLLSAIYNPFLSLPSDFKAIAGTDANEIGATIRNTQIPASKMFATGPEDIQGSWLEGNVKFMRGIDKLGEVLNGGR
jgi:hypothetical protein